MRGPRDLVGDVTARRERPRGGKVLQRLLLFEQERGLPTTPVTNKTSKRTNRSQRAAAALSDENIATRYAEAARTLTTIQPAAMVARGRGEQAQTAQPPTWQWLGPSVMPNGQTYGDTRIDVSGRVSSIAVDPRDQNHILCGSAAGGVWETRDGGATWAPRTDRMPTLTVGAVTFDPTNPDIAYCGTGEGNWYRHFGAGILRSTDGGTSWAVLSQAPFVGQGFYDLIVDPGNSNHLLAATTGGVYTSVDGGTTWTQQRTDWTWDLSKGPGASAEIFAAGSTGLVRSTNGGSTWTNIILPGAPATWERLAVDVARSNPDVVYVFGASGGNAFLYRRQRRARRRLVWVAVTLPAGLSAGQAWYDWFVAAAPDNDSQVYLGTIEAYRGDLAAGSWTWVTISNKAGTDIHPDQHALAVDPSDPNTVYVGNDGGLYRSPDRGSNWVALNNGLGITEIEYLAQDYGSSRWLIGGTQDNGSIRYRGSSVWDHVQDGDGGDCGVNRGTPDIVFHTFYGMGMERSTTKADWSSWTWLGPNVPQGYNALFYPPMECNNSTVAQAGQSLFVSRDNGDNWTEIALAAGVVATSMYIPTTDRVLVGTSAGRLFQIDWTGTAWNAAAELTRPRAAWMSDVFADPNTNRMWVTYSQLGGGRLFRSDDGGATWNDMTSGLPDLPINAIEIDPWNANRVWVAADIGVYQSFDAGSSWAAFSLGLPNVLVYDLVFHPHARILRAGTRNRGAWEIPVDGWLSDPICGVQWVGNLAGNASARWFTFNWPATWHVLWTVMPTNPRPGGPQVIWDVQVERASSEYVTYWISVVNLTPDPLTFEGRYAILSRY